MSAILSKYKVHVTAATVGAVLLAVGGYLTGTVDIVTAGQAVVHALFN